MDTDNEPVKARENYYIDKMMYSIPTEKEIDDIKLDNEIYFEDPEKLLDSWICGALLHGPKLMDFIIEHFRTLSAEDMPETYIDDVITEFWERIETKLFAIKNKRFKLIKSRDTVSQEFSRELDLRTGLTIDNIDEMTGIEFEHFLCRLFSNDGYKATVTKASNDQGADLILERSGERIVVQAKRYFGAVSNTAIQEVVAAKAIYKCINAMVVTNSYFTKSAIILALSNKVTLYDREKLKEKLKDYNFKVSEDL